MKDIEKKNEIEKYYKKRFLGTEFYYEQPLPTRHDSYLPESSEGGMHYEIGVLDDYDKDKE